MTKRPQLVFPAIALALLLFALAALYFVDSASALPSFVPGHEAGSAHHHVKHGIAALLLGIGALVLAWFPTGPTRTSPQEPPAHGGSRADHRVQERDAAGMAVHMIAGMPNPSASDEPAPVADRQRLEALERITDAALASLSVEQLLHELLLRITEIINSDTAAILLLDETGTLLHARAAKGIEEEVEQGVKIPVGRGFAGRVAAERRAVFIEDVDHADVLNPILREKGIHSLLGVPLLVEQRVLGVLHVGSLVPREFTGEEAALLQLAADRAAIAIEHATLYEQRQLAELLQRRLLPTDVSITGGLGGGG
ncbi:MAG: GAF domain-containing protein, partial [Conexibacter sp.]